MEIEIKKFEKKDKNEMIAIWNEIVEEGVAFPQMESLDEISGLNFFESQSYCGVAQNVQTKEILGFYILHPNNIGRCGHISNASFAVKSSARGLHIGEKLVKDCMKRAKEIGFQILQFNAVVKTNKGARHLYEKLGFTPLGTIPDGFLMKDGTYEDIVVYYSKL